MKVLMLKGYYEPEIAASLYLTTDLVEDMIKEGIQVEIITPIPTRGVTNEIRKQYKKKKVENLEEGKLTVYRYWLPKESKNIFLRAIRYIWGGIIHFVKALQIETDLIIIGSTPPTNGIIGALLSRIKKVPFIYVLQDIFPDSMVTTKMTKKGSLVWKLGREIENFTYKNADKIIVISEDFKKNLVYKKVNPSKIEVIYNWVDENAVVPIKKSENILFDKLKLDKSLFYVVYAGNLGNAQNIEIILNAAKQTEDNKNIKYIIFGTGTQEELYKEMAAKLQLSNLEFHPLQPYDLVSQVYSLGDVCIVSCKKGFGTSAMPSKTWSIMSAGTAVLASFDEKTDMQRIIETNNVGIFTHSDNEEELIKAILTLYNDKELCKQMGRNGREYILNFLSRNKQTMKYIELIKGNISL